jgi:hypothetical protein
MRWIIGVDRREAAEGLAWVRAFLEKYDTSRIEWVRIDRGRGRYLGVYGRCWYPNRERPTYRISCQVPGPYPTTVQTRQRPLYRRPNGTWPRVPKGCFVRGYGRDSRSGRVWLRLGAITRLENVNEGIVWIFGHEVFHFLRHCRQIDGRNTEIEADRFADEVLKRFRSDLAAQRRRLLRRRAS